MNILLLFLVISVGNTLKFVDWIPRNSLQFTTICTCVYSPQCDKPWITWGFIVKLENNELFEELACVILDNEEILLNHENINVLTQTQKIKILENKNLLKHYFDHHIYFNNSQYTLYKECHLKPWFIIFKTSDSNYWIYNPENKLIQFKKSESVRDVYFIHLKIIKTFRIYVKQYRIDNQLEFIYRGVYREVCYRKKEHIKIVSFFDLINI